MDPARFNSHLSSVGVRGPGRHESQFLPTRTHQPVAVMVAQAHNPVAARGTQWRSQDGEQREHPAQSPPQEYSPGRIREERWVAHLLQEDRWEARTETRGFRWLQRK